MVVFDSINSLHRTEFTGTETLAERQQRKIVRLAEVYNIAVVITNQVKSQRELPISRSGCIWRKKLGSLREMTKMLARSYRNRG